MKRSITLASAIALLPFTAFAMPEIGAMIGTNPEAASAALKQAGCEVREFDTEDGMIEAKCTETATGKHWEVYINPAEGTVVQMKIDD